MSGWWVGSGVFAGTLCEALGLCQVGSCRVRHFQGCVVVGCLVWLLVLWACCLRLLALCALLRVLVGWFILGLFVLLGVALGLI